MKFVGGGDICFLWKQILVHLLDENLSMKNSKDPDQLAFKRGCKCAG